MNKFTSTTHHAITSTTNPSLNRLVSPLVVCIIGASEGIGEQIAYSYALAGATTLILCCRNVASLLPVSQKLISINSSITISTLSCDISSSSSVATLAAHITTAFGHLDVLISNPGYAGPITLKVTDGDPAWFQTNFEVNTVGTYHAAHYLIPLLLSSKGGMKMFIVIGSLAANLVNGPIANTGYCISKLAQSRLVEMIGEQFGGEVERGGGGGLLVLSVHPGAVLTGMAKGNTPEEFMPYMVDSADLCGGVCIWLSKNRTELQWLNGRFVSAKWDMDELVARKHEVLEKDLLKWDMKT